MGIELSQQKPLVSWRSLLFADNKESYREDIVIYRALYKLDPIKYSGGVRRKCEFPDCNKSGRNKGIYKGKTRYDRFCEQHHRRVSGHFFLDKQRIDNSSCTICGWDKARCDRHRINPKVGYTKENVKVLCPNCHRLVTLGIVNLKP